MAEDRDDDRYDRRRSDDRNERRRGDEFEDAPRSRRRRDPEDDEQYADDIDRPRYRDDAPRSRGGSPILIILLIVAVVVLVIVGILAMLLVPAISKVRTAAQRVNSMNDAKQTILACHLYQDKHDRLPHNLYAPDGKPLLSWRVGLLPFLGEDALAARIRNDETWDSLSNRGTLSPMPKPFQLGLPQNPAVTAGKTFMRGFNGPGSVFESRPVDWGFDPKKNLAGGAPKPLGGKKGPDGSLPLALNQFKDSTASTIVFFEAGAAVDWTKPEDVDISPMRPWPSFGGAGISPGQFLVAYADGSVRMIPTGLPEIQIRGLSTHSGGEIVEVP